MNPSWVQIALAEQGQAEIAGAEHNPRIVAYHATTGYRAKDDETPWCASFVNWCLQQAGIKGTASAAASSFTNWGVFLDKPTLGAVVVFTRKGGGHVGFYMGERNGKWLVLGGNQSNRVSIAPYNPDQAIAIRWPSGVPLPNAVAPLRQSGVIKGSVLAGVASVAQVGAGLLDQKEAIDTAQGYLNQGGIIGIVLGLLALVGIVWVVVSRINGKKASQ